jgi:hypothetical protein
MLRVTYAVRQPYSLMRPHEFVTKEELAMDVSTVEVRMTTKTERGITQKLPELVYAWAELEPLAPPRRVAVPEAPRPSARPQIEAPRSALPPRMSRD